MVQESLYDFTQFKHDELIDKKHLWGWHAYQIGFNSSDDRCTRRIHCILPLDCDGAPVPTAVSGKTSSMFASLCPGVEWAHPRYTLWNAYDWTEQPLIIVDRRTFWMILMGCCPKFEEYL